MGKSIKLKVCGMRENENILALAQLQPDYMGFIFYPSSKRFAGNLDAELLKSLPNSIKKTGVFVNASEKDIIETTEKYNLQAIQLHGNETPGFCFNLKSMNVEIIKAFGIDENFGFNTLSSYQDTVDYFLFDTKTALHGGSGQVFEWTLLGNYNLDMPYFLSGGLSPENISSLQSITDNRLYAADLNSCFETQPGLKDIEKLKTFFTNIKSSASAENRSL